MTIRHFCLSGGGIVGIVMYGIVKRLNRLKVWKHEDIESIYCCSIGSVIGLIIILDIEWDWMDDFWIKRPWDKIFNIRDIDYFQYITDKGVFDENTWIKVVTPLLKSRGMKPDITILELYRETNIEYNVFITDMNNVTKTVINHKTFPDMRVTYAIYITTCIPYVCKPAFLNGSLYIDGGLTNNVPINDCLFNNNCDESEVINITNEFDPRYIFSLDSKYVVDDSLIASDNFDQSNNDILDNNSDNNDNNIDNNDNNIDNIDDRDVILDISNNVNNTETESFDSIINTEIDEHCNVFQFSMFLLMKMANQFMFLNTCNNKMIKNTIRARFTSCSALDVRYWLDIIFNRHHIATCIDYGGILADTFYRDNQV